VSVQYNNLSDIIGKIVTETEVDYTENVIQLKTSDGCTYRMMHNQDCCETVHIEDICGDMNDLVGSPILMAEEATSQDPTPEMELQEHLHLMEEPSNESRTWTFYKFATVKGYVTIRWLGQSNGYYSENVDFEKIETRG
jgi:hypothetical protein